VADPAALAIRVGDVFAGTLTRSNEGSAFALADSYLADPYRPILGQSFEDEPGATTWSRQGVPNWFANLLPEGPLRRLIAEKADVHPDRSFFLLAVLGLDLPGAVVAIPEINGKDLPPLVDPGQVDDVDGGLMKFSLAGVQLKFSAVKDDRGLTIPAHGVGGSWIVKLPDAVHPFVPENEFSMMRWAAESGINVPEIQLVPVSEIAGLPSEVVERGGVALAVRRFDRPDAGGRVHIEDFAQILNKPPAEKYGSTNYETLARVLAATTPDGDVDELVRRLALNVLMGNGDAHLKNWSLTYPDGRAARLAPAYDLVSTVQYVPDDTHALNLGGEKEFARLDTDRFRRFAERAHLDPENVAGLALETASIARDVWATLKEELPMPLEFRARIDERLRLLPLSREAD
jgi:serine/threonine-protein kinase HipA